MYHCNLVLAMHSARGILAPKNSKFPFSYPFSSQLLFAWMTVVCPMHTRWVVVGRCQKWEETNVCCGHAWTRALKRYNSSKPQMARWHCPHYLLRLELSTRKNTAWWTFSLQRTCGLFWGSGNLFVPLKSLNLAGNKASNSCLHQRKMNPNFHVPPTSWEMQICVYIYVLATSYCCYCCCKNTHMPRRKNRAPTYL